MAGKTLYTLSSPAPLTLACLHGSGEEDPTQTLILGPRTEGTGSRRAQPPLESSFQKTNCLLLGAEGVASGALGSGISKGAAITAGLGLSTGTSSNGATAKVTPGGGQAVSDSSPGWLRGLSQAHSGVKGKFRPKIISRLTVCLEAGSSEGYSSGHRPLVLPPKQGAGLGM